MDQILQNEIFPPALFFIFFSLAFSLLEVIVILILNRLGQRYWEFMIDVVIRWRVHHGKLIRCIVLIGLAIFAGVIFWYTPLIEVLVTSSKELRLFALLLALVMFLFYSINLRKSTDLDIGKKIYNSFFFIISLALYTFILILANQSYGNYARYVQLKLVNPTLKGVTTVMAEQEKKTLLDKFRKAYLNNECLLVDYSKKTNGEGLVKNFILIASEPELAYGKKVIDLNDPKAFLRGKACSDDKNTFLLTEWGDWYWVIDKNLAPQKGN